MNQTTPTVNVQHESMGQKIARIWRKWTHQSHSRPERRPDPVDEAGKQSFPASDPPSWTLRPF